MRWLLVLFVFLASSLQARELDGATILARAAQAHGGDEWANARTLALEGRAVFYAPGGAAPRSIADDYRMWRVFDPDRAAAHGADGKLRIVAKSGARTLFTVGYDGATTWNERGGVPKAEADAFWASNFGFGIIRHAGKPGFKAERVPAVVRYRRAQPRDPHDGLHHAEGLARAALRRFHAADASELAPSAQGHPILQWREGERSLLAALPRERPD